ncbi:MAG: DUF3048 C-terminal domain-containing protein [Clostridia bacterium]|nr:DUF3048 C-terminal domain-containing protein [Clostridia bacterium]
MKQQKKSTFYKFLSLALIAVFIVSAVGFAVSGREGNEPPTDNGEVGNKTDDSEQDKNNSNTPPNNSNGDGGDDSNVDEGSDTPPVAPPEVTYINKITGLSVSEAAASAIPVGIVLDPSTALYGISNSDISIEFPIEDGSTRLLSYSTNEEIMWKIGALKATRNYISNMSNFFGGVVVSYGNDDKVIYDAWETDKITLDLSKYSDCYYVENTIYIYTTESMIDTAKNRMPTDTTLAPYNTPPYAFCEDGTVEGVTQASTVKIDYSAKSSTVLYYHKDTGKYLYYKGDSQKIDMLTGKSLSFDNVFILFSNSVTYENSTGTELVIDTVSGGKGYYISRGTLTEFVWETTSNGELVFKSLMGQTLVVNRGTAYIAYYKASQTNGITIS